MTKPRLLDLFSGAGGCGMGYHLAGFEVIGIDNVFQPRYPFDFIQADALEYLAEYGHEYDFIHASPPCQHYSVTSNMHQSYEYPDLLPEARRLLHRLNIPFVIENVPGAPLEKSVRLRGDMFGLQVLRMRYFETNFHVVSPPLPRKSGRTSGNGKSYSTLDDAEFITVAGNNFRYADGKKAMAIDWMTRSELKEAIPPVYTQYIGATWLKANGFSHLHPSTNVLIQQSFLTNLGA